MNNYTKYDELAKALAETRTEPGLPLEEVAGIMVKVFDPAELEELVKEIAKRSEQKFIDLHENKNNNKGICL